MQHKESSMKALFTLAIDCCAYFFYLLTVAIVSLIFGRRNHPKMAACHGELAYLLRSSEPQLQVARSSGA